MRAWICVLALCLAGARAERNLKETYVLSLSSSSGGDGGSVLVQEGNGQPSDAAEVAARFLGSPASDEVALESAAAGVRAARAEFAADRSAAAEGVALLDRLLSGPGSVQRPEEGRPEEGAADRELRGAAEEQQAPPGGLVVLDGRGAGALAEMLAPSRLADAFVREAFSVLDAVLAQEQAFERAIAVQQQAALRAGAAGGMRGGRVFEVVMGGGPPRVTTALIGGQELQLVDLSAGDGAVAVPSDGYLSAGEEGEGADDEGEAAAGGFALDQLLVVVLSAVCAVTFVAFVRSLAQLRAAMLSGGGAGDGLAYAKLPKDADVGAGGKGERHVHYPVTSWSRRASRHSSSDGAAALEQPFLVDEADLSGARELAPPPRVLVVTHVEGLERGFQNECFNLPKH